MLLNRLLSCPFTCGLATSVPRNPDPTCSMNGSAIFPEGQDYAGPGRASTSFLLALARSGRSTLTPAAAPALTGTPEYLSDTTPANDPYGDLVTPGLVKIYGSTYPKSISFYCNSAGDNNYPTYTLDQDARTFKATIGVEAKWPTDYLVGASIVGDGHTLKIFSVSVLKPMSIEIIVVSIHLLQLECSDAVDASGTGGWPVTVAWGNARVVERR